MALTQKRAKRKGETVLFVDESGFYPLPGVVRTFAPRGERPVLKEWSTRDHLSAISAITSSGLLFFRAQDHAFDSEGIVDFLRQLLRAISGRLVVIWDGAPIHRSRVVKEFLRSEGCGRLTLERLPGYAPDLNPDEGVWQHLKHVELRNLCCTDLAALGKELRLAVRRMRRRPTLISSFFAGAGL